MNFPIRTKLTFWYVTLLTVSLVLFSLSFFYALSKVYIDTIDESMESLAGMMEHTMVRPHGEMIVPKNFDIILGRFFGVRTEGKYIQVLDPKGRLAAKSSNLEGIELPRSDITLALALKGEKTLETVKTFGLYPVRVLTKPVVLRDYGLVAIVQVGASLEGMQQIYHYMSYFFIFGILASIVVASAVGYFLAVKALEPVDEITTVARRLGAESLDERLPEAGTRDELGRLSSTFNEMLARLERSFSQIKQFTADASHELKTPITAMRGEIEVALRGKASAEELKEVLESNIEEVDRMSHIISNLLSLARADAEAGGASMAEVSFDAVVTDIFELIKRSAEEKDLDYALLRTEPTVVLADRVRLGQVVTNLVDNAVKYTPPGGSVEIGLVRDNGWAILKVRDTGVGISEVDLPHVFNRFFRTDKARMRESGMDTASVGLGLSICKEIVESFGGSIRAESGLGKGSCFSVRLPIEEQGAGGSG